MSNYVTNFDVENYSNQTTIPQLIANNMSGCFFPETRCKCMPIVLYGFECFSVAKTDTKSLDFAGMPTLFLMKLLRTTNIDVIEHCRLFLKVLLPSEMFEIRRAKFECKLMNCNNVLNYFGLGVIV